MAGQLDSGSATDAPDLRGEPVRWFFENRETGGITIAQWPNWMILGWAGSALVERLVSDALISGIAAFASFVFAIIWASSEMVGGVNPFRRLLGAAVILWQVGQLLLSAS